MSLFNRDIKIARHMSDPPPTPRRKVWRKLNASLWLAIAMHGAQAGRAAPVASPAIMTAPKRQPVQVITANLNASRSVDCFLNTALDTRSISPVQAPIPVMDTNIMLRGKPTAPERNLSNPLPGNHGSLPMSKPTLNCGSREIAQLQRVNKDVSCSQPCS